MGASRITEDRAAAGTSPRDESPDPSRRSMGDDLVTGKDPGGGYGGDHVSCPSCAKLIPRSASFGPAEDRVYLCPRCQNVYKLPEGGVPKGRAFRSRHVADKSELVRSADGRLRFRARCTLAAGRANKFLPSGSLQPGKSTARRLVPGRTETNPLRSRQVPHRHHRHVRIGTSGMSADRARGRLCATPAMAPSSPYRCLRGCERLPGRATREKCGWRLVRGVL